MQLEGIPKQATKQTDYHKGKGPIRISNTVTDRPAQPSVTTTVGADDIITSKLFNYFSRQHGSYGVGTPGIILSQRIQDIFDDLAAWIQKTPVEEIEQKIDEEVSSLSKPWPSKGICDPETMKIFVVTDQAFAETVDDYADEEVEVGLRFLNGAEFEWLGEFEWLRAGRDDVSEDGILPIGFVVVLSLLVSPEETTFTLEGNPTRDIAYSQNLLWLGTSVLLSGLYLKRIFGFCAKLYIYIFNVCLIYYALMKATITLTVIAMCTSVIELQFDGMSLMGGMTDGAALRVTCWPRLIVRYEDMRQGIVFTARIFIKSFHMGRGMTMRIGLISKGRMMMRVNLMWTLRKMQPNPLIDLKKSKSSADRNPRTKSTLTKSMQSVRRRTLHRPHHRSRKVHCCDESPCQ